MSWIGGKKALRELIVSLFPIYYERYIEVFGGGGWVLFHKPPGNDFEVYNDFNGLLVNLYRCVREKPEELMEALRFVLNAVYQSDLSHRARAVYMYLKDRSDAEGQCWPAIKTIGAELGLSRSTVKRALDDLCKAGLLQKDPRWRENGSYTSNLYRLL